MKTSSFNQPNQPNPRNNPSNLSFTDKFLISTGFLTAATTTATCFNTIHREKLRDQRRACKRYEKSGNVKKGIREMGRSGLKAERIEEELSDKGGIYLNADLTKPGKDYKVVIEKKGFLFWENKKSKFISLKKNIPSNTSSKPSSSFPVSQDLSCFQESKENQDFNDFDNKEIKLPYVKKSMYNYSFNDFYPNGIYSAPDLTVPDGIYLAPDLTVPVKQSKSINTNTIDNMINQSEGLIESTSEIQPDSITISPSGQVMKSYTMMEYEPAFPIWLNTTPGVFCTALFYGVITGLVFILSYKILFSFYKENTNNDNSYQVYLIVLAYNKSELTLSQAIYLLQMEHKLSYCSALNLLEPSKDDYEKYSQLPLTVEPILLPPPPPPLPPLQKNGIIR